MKYRIVETGKGFVIQFKILFWWINWSYRPLYFAGHYLGWEWGSFRTIYYFESKDDAVKQLNFIRQYPIRYKGHIIHAANRYDYPVFYELASIFDDKIFNLVAEDLGKLIKEIDKKEEEELKRKRESKILKIYDEHGNHKN